METGDWSILGLVFFRASLPYLEINSPQSWYSCRWACSLCCHNHLTGPVLPVRQSQRKAPNTRRHMLFTQAEVNEDEEDADKPPRRPQRNVQHSNLPHTHRHQSHFQLPGWNSSPPRPPRDTKTFNPYTQLGTLTCKGRSQKSRLKSHWCRRVETRWRPEGEADKEQFNIHSAPRKLQAPRWISPHLRFYHFFILPSC